MLELDGVSEVDVERVGDGETVGEVVWPEQSASSAKSTENPMGRAKLQRPESNVRDHHGTLQECIGGGAHIGVG